MTNEERREDKELLKHLKRQPIRNTIHIDMSTISEQEATNYIKNLRNKWRNHDRK